MRVRIYGWCDSLFNHGKSMQSVCSLMAKPAPAHVVDALCQRLREIESIEKDQGGEDLANECRSFIYQQGEVKWMDVMMTAYLVNGGVILRDASSATPSPSNSARSNTKTVPEEVAIASPSAVGAGAGVLIKSPDGSASRDFTDTDLLEIESMVNSLGIGLEGDERLGNE